jgi:tRNA dimethylallyltransferase
LRGDLDAMKRRARQLARRQMTWMRKLPDINVIDVSERTPAEVAAVVADLARR